MRQDPTHHEFRVQVAGGSLEASLTTPDLATAEAFVSTLPRSIGLRAGTLSWATDETCQETRSCGRVTLRVKLDADGVNGGANEAGIKRFRALVRRCAKNGIPVQWVAPYSYSLSEEEAIRQYGIL